MNNKIKKETLMSLKKGGKFVSSKFEIFKLKDNIISELEFSIYPFAIREVLINTHSEIFIYFFSFYISLGIGLGK